MPTRTPKAKTSDLESLTGTINGLIDRVTALEAATGVNPPATGETVERTILNRLDVLEQRHP